MPRYPLSSDTLDRWRQHVVAALHSQRTFAAYAREHGVSANMLYVAHRQMKASGEVPDQPHRGATSSSKDNAARPASRNPFVPVQLAPTAGIFSGCMARLPNGVELHVAHLDRQTLYALAELPCSA